MSVAKQYRLELVPREEQSPAQRAKYGVCWAISKRDHETVRRLLNEEKFEIDDQKELPHGTILNYAVQRNTTETVQLILDAGANPNVPSGRGLRRRFVLHEACERGFVNVVRQLLDHDPPARMNAVDGQGDTPLMRACRKCHTHVVALLMEHGRQPCDINWQDARGDTPLHIAIGRGNAPLVEMLLSFSPDVDVVNKHGYTPLLRAVAKGSAQMVELLLRHYPPPDIEARNKDGSTPMMIAVNTGSTAICELLLNHVHPPRLWVTDRWDKSAFDYDNKSLHHKIKKYMRRHMRVLLSSAIEEVMPEVPRFVSYEITRWCY